MENEEYCGECKEIFTDNCFDNCFKCNQLFQHPDEGYYCENHRKIYGSSFEHKIYKFNNDKKYTMNVTLSIPICVQCRTDKRINKYKKSVIEHFEVYEKCNYKYRDGWLEIK